MPTAETYARSFRGIGIPAYSSAMFNFIPRTALAFHHALNSGDDATVDRLLKDFFIPYVRIRNKGQGYAVSIVKAGARSSAAAPARCGRRCRTARRRKLRAAEVDRGDGSAGLIR